MAHLRSARNVSNLQVDSLRYDRADIPPYGGVLSVETTGKVTVTDELRLRNLNVIDSIAVGTTLQVNGALTAGSADIYGTLTASDDLFVDGSAVFTGNVDLCGNLTAKDGNFNFLFVDSLYARALDVSGLIFGDDLDISGNMLIYGTSQLRGHTRLYDGLGVTGRATFHNGIVVNGPGATLASLRVTGAESVAGGLSVTGGGLQVTGGGLSVTGGGLQVTGGAVLSNTLRVNGAATFNNNMTVAGTFRSGGLATFASGASVIGNETVSANLLVGGSVGIGTSTPTTRLEINDPTNPKIYMTGVGGVTGFFSRGSIGIDIGNEGTAVPIRFMPGNTERVRIDGSGNIGVGTSTPATVVQISNPTQTALTGLAVSSSDVNTIIGNYTGPYTAGANYGSIQTTTFGGATTIGTTPYPLVLQPLGGRVCVGGAEYNAIANTEKFQIADNVLVRAGLGITTGTGYSTSYITLNNANAGATTNQQTLTVSMDATSGAILNTAAIGTATTPNLVFQASGTERARVTNSGQVALSVAGDVLGYNIHATGFVGTTYIAGQGAYLSWNNDGFNGQTYIIDQRGSGNGGFRFQIFDNTNTIVKEPFSITNTNSIAQATVTQSDAATGVTATSTAALTLQNATAGAHTLSFYTNMNVGDYNSLTQAGDKGIFFSNGTVNTGNLVIGPWTDSAAGLRIDSSGNVGIGVASPAAALDVIGTTPFAGMNTANPFTSSLILRTTTGSEKLMMGAYYTSGQGALGAIQASDYYSNAEHPNTLALNPLGGNVGIGTLSPAYTLDVNGTANVKNLFITPNITSTSILSMIPLVFLHQDIGPTGRPNTSYPPLGNTNGVQTSFTGQNMWNIVGGDNLIATLAPNITFTLYSSNLAVAPIYFTNTYSYYIYVDVPDPGVFDENGTYIAYSISYN